MKIGSVPYINALPLVHHLPLFLKSVPALLAQHLIREELDVALLPVFSSLKENFYIYPEAGIIGCDGTVGSVGLFCARHISEVSQIKSLALDPASLSSVHLCKIIFQEFLHIDFSSLTLVPETLKHQADAFLLIGDAALFLNDHSDYNYFDLGHLWKQFTQLGFTFATWASRKPLLPEQLEPLIQSKNKGLENLPQLAQTVSPKNPEKILNYFTQNIIHTPNFQTTQGLERYRQLLIKWGFLSPHAYLRVA